MIAALLIALLAVPTQVTVTDSSGAKSASVTVAGVTGTNALAVQGVTGGVALNVNITGGTISGADPTSNAAPGAAIPAKVDVIGGSDYAGSPAVQTAKIDSSGLVHVSIDAGGGSGGTASSFAAAFPATGTAVGFSDGTNMQGARVFDADTGAGTQYVAGVSLRKSASGGSVEAGTSSDPLRVDPTGTTPQPVTQSGTWTVTTTATGHGTAVGSIRVELPTDGTGLVIVKPDVTAATTAAWTSATVADTAATLTTTNYGIATVSFNVSGGAITAGTVNFECSDDASTFYACQLFRTSASSSETTYVLTGANQLWQINVGAMKRLRVRLNPQITGAGTANITLQASAAAMGGGGGGGGASSTVAQGNTGTNAQAWWVQIGDTTNGPAAVKAASTAAIATDKALVVAISPNNTVPVSTAQIAGTTTLTGNGVTGAGSQRVTIASDNTAFTVNAAQSGTWTVQQGSPPWSVVGNVASAAADSGNPVKVGAIFNTTQPTVTNGQRVDAQATSRGAIIVATGADAFNIGNITGTISLPTGAATESSLAKLTQAQGSTTSTQSGPLVQGATTTGAPTYVTATTNPLSLSVNGELRVSGAILNGNGISNTGAIALTAINGAASPSARWLTAGENGGLAQSTSANNSGTAPGLTFLNTSSIGAGNTTTNVSGWTDHTLTVSAGGTTTFTVTLEASYASNGTFFTLGTVTGSNASVNAVIHATGYFPFLRANLVSDSNAVTITAMYYGTVIAAGTSKQASSGMVALSPYAAAQALTSTASGNVCFRNLPTSADTVWMGGSSSVNDTNGTPFYPGEGDCRQVFNASVLFFFTKAGATVAFDVVN